jgi:hypothetical protein
MAKKLTSDKAQQFLTEVGPDKCFYVFNGPVLKCISDLNTNLPNMTDEQFSYHRNGQKNDFYNWILNVIGDVKLANDIARARTKETTFKKVNERYEFLEKIKNGNGL